MSRRNLFPLTVCILVLLNICVAADTRQTWNASLKYWPGFQLKDKQGELCIYSGIIAVEPPWKQLRFYTKETKLEKKIEKHNNKTATHLFSADKSREIYLEDYSLTTEQNTWRLNVELRQNGNAPTNVEYTALVLPEESLLPGGDYRWTDADYKEHFGRLSNTPLTAIKKFLSLELSTTFGTLTIKVNHGLPLTLGDRRVKTYLGRKSFWIGILSSPISKNAPFKHNVTVTLKPYPENYGAKQIFKPVTYAKAPLLHTDALNQPVKPQKFNLPVPKQVVEVSSENFTPAKTVTLHFDASLSSKRLRKAAGRILRKAGLETKTGSKDTSIQLKYNSSLQGNDAYRLTVSKSGITIESATERGAFYALQTLAQRFTGRYFPGCRITDSADFAVRGLHIIPDSDSQSFHGKLIEDVLAPAKINHIILESEYVKWDATKGFHHPQGMSKESLRKLLEAAYDNYIDVTPLIQSFGHCQWLFYNRQNLDLADNPSRPNDYNPSNPRTYQVMRNVLDETVTFFKADMLHIGHDEIKMISSKQPFRKENQTKSLEKILLDDLLWYCNYAADKKIKLMLWHDMIMNNDECEGLANSAGIPAVRKFLPHNNTTVTYWHYSPRRKNYPAVDLLQREGFEVYPVAWDRPGNVENFAVYCKKRNIPALFGSTWAGYFGTQSVLDKEYSQISAYLRVAAWGWNATPEVNHHDYDRLLLELLDRGKGKTPVFKGAMLDLSDFAILPLKKEDNPLGTEHIFGIEQLPKEPFFCGDIKFKPISRNGVPAAITLRSSRVPNAPSSVAIPLNEKVEELYFLQTTLNEILRGVPIVSCTIVYSDGSKVKLPIRYGMEVNSPKGVFNIRFNHHNSHPLSWNDSKGKISYFKWKNPYKDKKVSSITFSNGNFGQPFLLLGISLK